VSKLSVFPDCVIESDGVRPKMLLDAKYKGHVEKGQLRISEADIYEALAFARASMCNLVVLAYPALPGDKEQAVGTCTVFEKVSVDAVQIVGIQVESRLISMAGALRTFASNMASGVAAAFS
jgi:5-methylcytosine-specific restriction endonuclease McrBC regulatory subunit McrC